jgi:hypothetical protein
MKHLAPLALIPLAATLSSCAVASKVIQTPVRLLQAGARTVTEADDLTPPATREATGLQGLALKVSEAIED